MLHTLRFFIINQIKQSKIKSSSAGFTLIELLVALAIAFLVITPLMLLMLGIMNTDRQEQAKATTEQEIQAALDYISRDLQQAVYIYDGTGVNAIKDELPNADSTDRVPVLVFWKRELRNQVLPVNNGNNDTFVYSLVAYFLVKDNNTNWKGARITRWQISDGVASNSDQGVTCPGYSGTYVSGYCPDSGYAPFNLDGIGTLEEKMNKWERLDSYTVKENDKDVKKDVSTSSPIVLVDALDPTTTNAPAKIACDDNNSATNNDTTRMLVAPDINDTSDLTSFYACVDRINTTAQVFIRGNALTRIETDANKTKYSDSRSVYFPSASVRVEGRGFLYTK